MQNKLPVIVLILFFSSLLFASEIKLTASDREAGDQFGDKVCIDGDFIFVGTPRNNVADVMTGAVYIYQRVDTTWIEQAEIVSSNAKKDDRFGTSISVSGDYAVIGAPQNDSLAQNAGAAYIFHRNGSVWTEQVILFTSDGEANDQIGKYVSISGDYLALGSTFENSAAYCAGAVYVFHRDGDTWTEQAKVTASNAGSRGYFGSSVSINGDYMFVGSEHYTYIFHRDGTSWTEQTIINRSQPESISISEEYAVIGYPANGREAYIYHLDGSTWTEQARIAASDSIDAYEFGCSVSIGNEYLIVGAQKATVNENINGGAAYLFHRDGTEWIEQVKISSSDSKRDDKFGNSVSINSGHIVIGASASDINFSDMDNAGAAYIYTTDVTAIPSFNNTQPAREFILHDNYPNPFNPSTTVRFDVPEGSGILNSVTLTVYNALGQQVGILYNGYISGGQHEVLWNAAQIPSGIYFVMLRSGRFMQTKKMILLR